MNGRRLIISQQERDGALEAAIDAAKASYVGRKIGSGTTFLIEVAVEAAIDFLELDLK